ncbi:MAG: class I SAM-dependent methyltransferase [Desulfobacterales bacterium]|nr:MAG: class I SAM-dependent methyltransferase [Desulfobacterales bacterium]
MPHGAYLMESEEEALRLDLKTDGQVAEKQALWAGIQPGMRVADLGCGSGKTTFHLNKLVQPGGGALGVDIAEQRVRFAQERYPHEQLEYICRDIREPLEDLGLFDFVWVRFVLEYYLASSFDIVKHISKSLKPGGIMCLIDLDCNCLRHHGLSARLENALNGIMTNLQRFDFDPYVGIKLYAYLYDLGYHEIDVNVTPHNLIFGELKAKDNFNWTQKVEIAARHSGYRFEEFEGGYEEFFEEFKAFFADRRRFTYTPLISCRGRKPTA